MLKKIGLLMLLVWVSTFAFAEDVPKPDQEQKAKEFTQSLKLQSGNITLPNNIASLTLPENFNYLDAHDAERVLTEAWGNPPDDSTLGLIVPKDFDPFNRSSWAVVITYDEDGHVNDSDAKDINYDDLLKQMKEDVNNANEERKKQGYGSIQLQGWAEKPSYDNVSHKL